MYTVFRKIRFLSFLSTFLLFLLLPIEPLLASGIEDGYPPPASAKAGVYGYSGQGRPLMAYRFGNGQNVMVLCFCIHGFEDSFPRDGECLVYAASKTMEMLEQQAALLSQYDWSVYVLPCLNPDGLNSGYTNNGPGRCTTTYLTSDGALHTDRGIDMNRCFPVGWYRYTGSRNFTAGFPMACKEAAAIDSFIRQAKGNKANYLVDAHGWLKQVITYGSTGVVGRAFRSNFPGSTATYGGGSGYLAHYAETLGYESCLFEFPSDVYSLEQFKSSSYPGRYCNAILSLLQSVPSGCAAGSHQMQVTERQEATCQQAGYEIGVCQLCGASVEREIPIRAHQACDETILTPATATKSGVMTYRCALCGAENLTKEIPPLYQDADENAFYAAALENLSAKHLLPTAQNRNFDPNGTISRRELASLLYQSAGKPPTNGILPNADVPPQHSDFNALCWCSENGILTGLEEAPSHSGQALTRAEAASMFCGYAAAVGSTEAYQGNLSHYQDARDIPSPQWDGVSWCLGAHILSGTDEFHLMPAAPITRAQAIVMLNNLLKLPGIAPDAAN